jgi:hypothetical protein
MSPVFANVVARASDEFQVRPVRNFQRTASFFAAAVFLAITLGASPARAQNTARLANLSCRAQVGTGGNILIAGFVIGGSGSETLLVRAVGPGLAQFGLGGFLAQPSLSVFDSTGAVVASNTGWGTGAIPTLVANAAGSVGAFALAAGSADSALIVNLPAGSYTAQISGVNSATGIALAEIYEIAAAGTRLSNFSVRAQVGTGPNILISGLAIAGSGPESVLVRADGPALTQFGVTGVLVQPILNLINGAGALLVSNTGWNGFAPTVLTSTTGVTTVIPVSAIVTTVAQVAAAVGAFPLPPNSADSALTSALAPGNYTMQVSGVGNTTGVALIEIYETPTPIGLITPTPIPVLIGVVPGTG